MAVVNTNIGASVAQAALTRNDRALNTANGATLHRQKNQLSRR